MKEELQIPYIAYESELARSERHIKRLLIALVISVIAIFASNALWLVAWCQYDYSSEQVETTYTQDGEGINIIGDSNHVAE